MSVDRNSMAEFVKRNSHLGDAKQVMKFWLRLGRKCVLLSLIILSMKNIAPFLADHTFNRVLVLATINVCALLLVICMWQLSMRTCKKEIMKPPTPQAKSSKLNTIIAAIVPVSGVIGMYIGRTFFSNLTQNSALLAFSLAFAGVYAAMTFTACKSFYMAYLIKRFEIK